MDTRRMQVRGTCQGPARRPATSSGGLNASMPSVLPGFCRSSCVFTARRMCKSDTMNVEGFHSEGDHPCVGLNIIDARIGRAWNHKRLGETTSPEYRRSSLIDALCGLRRQSGSAIWRVTVRIPLCPFGSSAWPYLDGFDASAAPAHSTRHPWRAPRNGDEPCRTP